MESTLGAQTLVLPAYAGMIRGPSRSRGRSWRAPRVCGDDPDNWAIAGAFNPCSPRMRG